MLQHHLNVSKGKVYQAVSRNKSPYGLTTVQTLRAARCGLDRVTIRIDKDCLCNAIRTYLHRELRPTSGTSHAEGAVQGKAYRQQKAESEGEDGSHNKIRSS